MKVGSGSSGAGVYSQYSGGTVPLPSDLGFRPPATPSPFLMESLANFEHAFDQMTHVVAELEQLHLAQEGLQFPGGKRATDVRGLLLATRSGSGAGKEEEMDKSMTKILDNFVVYFNHVLSQYSQVHEKLRGVKKHFNEGQKQRGIERDYFAESDRKAVAAEERLKKEAEQKKQQAFAAANPQQQQQQPQSAVPQLGFGSTPAATTTTTPAVGGLGGLASPSPGLFSTPPQQAPGLGQSASLFSPSTFGAAPAAAAAVPQPAATGFGMSPTTPGLFGGANAFGGGAAFGQSTAGTGGGRSKSKSKSKRK